VARVAKRLLQGDPSAVELGLQLEMKLDYLSAVRENILFKRVQKTEIHLAC
jgi:hypothetical protein